MFVPMFKPACRTLVRGSSLFSGSQYLLLSTASCHRPRFCTQVLTVKNFQIRIYSAAFRETNAKNEKGSMSVPALLLACSISVIGLGIWSQQNPATTLNDAPPLYTQAIEQPVGSVESVIWRGMIFPALDLAAATTKLRAEETSTRFRTANATSPTRFDSIRVPSNNPPEDEKSYGAANIGETEWKFWGVYDGHAGWATARVLRACLTTYVAQAIQQAKKESPSDAAESIDNAIKKGFLNLDDEMMSDGLKALSDGCEHAEAISRIAPARAGSCALLAIFDPTNATLRVACTGDSRAVLGRYTGSTTQNGDLQVTKHYTTETLSEDQTGFNENEVQRINTAHPDEPEIIDKSSGRLLGMAVTRAFGDHRWKWPLEAITKCRSNFYGSSARPHYTSPPYMTAEPEIKTTQVGSGDFLIMASDGLWDHMSSEDAVECVSMWIKQEQAKAQKQPGEQPTATQESKSIAHDEKQDSKQEFSYWYKGTPEHFVVEDKNAATHLVRNAFGGSRRELFCSVMSTQAPDSRNVRDDVTVQVIFFGDILGTAASKL